MADEERIVINPNTDTWQAVEKAVRRELAKARRAIELPDATDRERQTLAGSINALRVVLALPHPDVPPEHEDPIDYGLATAEELYQQGE